MTLTELNIVTCLLKYGEVSIHDTEARKIQVIEQFLEEELVVAIEPQTCPTIKEYAACKRI